MCKITSGELCPAFGLPSTRNMPANWSESIAVISISRKVKQVKYLEKLKELGLFGIKKKRPSEDFIVTFNYLNGRSSEDGAQLFLEVHRERMSLKCTPAAGKEVLVRYMENIFTMGWSNIRTLKQSGRGIAILGDIKKPGEQRLQASWIKLVLL